MIDTNTLRVERRERETTSRRRVPILLFSFCLSIEWHMNIYLFRSNDRTISTRIDEMRCDAMRWCLLSQSSSDFYLRLSLFDQIASLFLGDFSSTPVRQWLWNIKIFLQWVRMIDLFFSLANFDSPITSRFSKHHFTWWFSSVKGKEMMLYSTDLCVFTHHYRETRVNEPFVNNRTTK